MTTVSKTYFYIVLLAALIVFGLVAQFYAGQQSSSASKGAENVISIQKIHADTPEVVASFYQGEKGSENILIKHQNLLERQIRKLNQQVGLYEKSINDEAVSKEQSTVQEVGYGWFALSQLISNLLDVSSELTTQNNTKATLGLALNEIQADVDGVAKALERESRIGAEVSKALNYVELVADVAQMKNIIAEMVKTQGDIGGLEQPPQALSDQLDASLNSFEQSLNELEAESDLLTQTKLSDVQIRFLALNEAVNDWQKSLDVLVNAHLVRVAVDKRSQDFGQQLSSLRQYQDSKNNQAWISWLGYLLPLLAALLLLFRGKTKLLEVATLASLSSQHLDSKEASISEIMSDSVTLVESLEQISEDLSEDLSEGLISEEQSSLKEDVDKNSTEIPVLNQEQVEEGFSSKKKNALKSKMRSYEAEITLLKENVAKFEMDNRSLTSELDQTRQESFDLQEALNQLEGNVVDVRSDTESPESLHADMQGEIETLKAEILELSNQNEVLLNESRQQLQSLEDSVSTDQYIEQTQAIEKLKLALDNERRQKLSFKESVEKYEQKNKDLLTERDEIKLQNQETQQDKTFNENSIKSLENEKQNLESAIEILESDLDEKVTVLEQQKSDFEDKFSKEKASSKATIEQLNKEILVLKDDRAESEQLREKLLSLESNYSELKLELDKKNETASQSMMKNDAILDYANQIEGLRSKDFSVDVSSESPLLSKVSETIAFLIQQIERNTTGVGIATEDVDDILHTIQSSNHSTNSNSEAIIKRLNQTIYKLSQLFSSFDQTSVILNKTASASAATFDMTDKSRGVINNSYKMTKELDNSLEQIQQGISKMTEPLESLSDTTVQVIEIVDLVDNLSGSAHLKLSESADLNEDPSLVLRRNIEVSDSVNLAAKKIVSAIERIREDTNTITQHLDKNLAILADTYHTSQSLEDSVEAYSKVNQQISRLHHVVNKRSENEMDRVNGMRGNIEKAIKQLEDVVSHPDVNALHQDVNDNKEIIVRLQNLRETLNALNEES